MSKACANFHLTISAKKTGSTPASTWKAVQRTNHHCEWTKLQVVDKFTYLGSTLSRAVHIDDEVTARTAKASVAFGRLRTNVWERNGIRLDTRLKVYKAVALPTLLYACETWTVYQRHAKKLNHFHLSCLNQMARQDPRYRGPEEGKDAKRTYSIEACTDGLAMSQECLMSDCQRKISMENCKKESDHKVAKRNATKTPLKPR